MKGTKRAARLHFLALGLCVSSWAPMVPIAKARLGLDDGMLGMMLLLFGLGALGAMPIAGSLVHYYGSRRITLISGICASLLLPFLAMAFSPLFLSLALFLFGIATGALNVSMNAQAVAIEAKESSSLMSGFHCLFSIGGLAAVSAISILLELKWPLSFSAGAVSLIIFLIFMLQGRYLLSWNEEGGCRHEESKRFTLPGFNLIFLGAICFIAFMAEGSMLDWSAEFLRSSRAYHPSVAGIGYGLFSVTMAFGRLFGDFLVRKFNPMVVFQLGSFLAAMGFAIVVYLPVKHGELIGFSLIGLGASNIVPILFSTSGRMFPASPGFALTFVTTFGYVGGVLGPAFIGFLAQATNLSFSLASLSICLIVAGASGRFIFASPPREPAMG